MNSMKDLYIDHQTQVFMIVKKFNYVNYVRSECHYFILSINSIH